MIGKARERPRTFECSKAIGSQSANPIRDRDQRSQQKSECTGAIFTFEPSSIESLANRGRPCTDGQQCAQVAIASFAHAQQIRPAPTGVLPWHQSQPRSDFTPTLIPIAAAYNIAHNFSNLLIQGQTVFQLLSDPGGRQWDIFGTAKWYPDIGLVDAQLTWYVAVVSIVLGHVMSI